MTITHTIRYGRYVWTAEHSGVVRCHTDIKPLVTWLTSRGYVASEIYGGLAIMSENGHNMVNFGDFMSRDFIFSKEVEEEMEGVA